jgi:Protein of unknown function (DUF2946)
LDEWVVRALARWPNVPALFGWLGLDRRGRWLVRGETITHPRIIETINRNYACDEHGRWYFQNGPQRGYVALACAPFVVRLADVRGGLVTHTDLPITAVSAAYLDEAGACLLATEHGPGEIAGGDLDWVFEQLRSTGGRPISEDDLARALAAPSGTETDLSLRIAGRETAVVRLDFERAPDALGFVREPQARPGERAAGGAPD